MSEQRELTDVELSRMIAEQLEPQPAVVGLSELHQGTPSIGGVWKYWDGKWVHGDYVKDAWLVLMLIEKVLRQRGVEIILGMPGVSIWAQAHVLCSVNADVPFGRAVAEAAAVLGAEGWKV
jgi:hypothetical protein